jgi:hypothetical protein
MAFTGHFGQHGREALVPAVAFQCLYDSDLKGLRHYPEQQHREPKLEGRPTSWDRLSEVCRSSAVEAGAIRPDNDERHQGSW